MTKWIALAAALALAVPAAGCRRKSAEESVDTSDRPSRKSAGSGSAGSAGSATAEAPAGPTDTGSAGSAAPLKPGELPPECTEFTTAMQKLSSCTTIPQTTRDALKATYDEAQKSWATMTPESKTTIAKACKGGADSVVAATAGCK